MAIRIPHEPEIDFSTFPETDGKPMADNEVNQEQMIELILEFRQAVAPRGHHVGGNLMVYYDPANGWNHCSPDVFVALDAGPALRESWKVWVEGKFPEVVFLHNVTSAIAIVPAYGARRGRRGRPRPNAPAPSGILTIL
jgi:hypothetical protein